MKKFTDGIKFGLGISLILGIFIIIGFYATKARSGTNNLTALTGDKLTANKRNTLVTQVNNSSIPSGLIAPFNTSTCPTGRTPADGTNGTVDLRGEFIRGLDNGRGIDSGRTLGSWQKPTLIVHEGGNQNAVYSMDYSSANAANAGAEAASSNGYSGVLPSGVSLLAATHAASRVRGPGTTQSDLTTSVVRPRNVALLYCVKN